MKMYLLVWVLLAGIVAVLALYRKWLTAGHYTVLHVRRSELPLVPGEVAYAQTLDRIDRWGKLLTWVVFVYGFALLLFLFYVSVLS